MRRRTLGRLAAGAIGYLVLTGCGQSQATPTQPPRKRSNLPILMESPPTLSGIKGWLNSRPLSLDDLKGTPSLVVFWTYT
jgi:hypothetical protein